MGFFVKYSHKLKKTSITILSTIILVSILSLAAWHAIRPINEVTFEEEQSSMPNTGSYSNNLMPYQDSTPNSDLISTGNPRYDQFDSYIISVSDHYDITDKLMVKSLIMQESYFDIYAISPDSPCGIPDGWTDKESKSFGLTQVTPACGEVGGTRPNLDTDANSPNWATSLFNPEYNINQGISEVSRMLFIMMNKFPECTNEQHMLMALGAYNSGESAIEGCTSWNDRANNYITNVTERYRTLSEMANVVHSN
jgi:soluble lytic murein transglycosylase-like protein